MQQKTKLFPMTLVSQAFKVCKWGSGLSLVCVFILSFFHLVQFHVVLSESMEPAVSVGSLAIIRSVSPGAYRVGDIIEYRDPLHPTQRILHRIVHLQPNRYGIVEVRTKGDRNTNGDLVPLALGSLQGRLVWAVPKVGFLLNWLSTTYGFLTAVFLTFLLCVFREVRYVMEALGNMRRA